MYQLLPRLLFATTTILCQTRRREIQGQTADETYRKFATELTTIMRQAIPSGYTEIHSISYMKTCIFNTSYPARTLVSSRRRCTDELEELKIQCRERQKSIKATITAATIYDRHECCWKCKQRGHTRFNCQRMPRKFCSQCGKDGIHS